MILWKLEDNHAFWNETNRENIKKIKLNKEELKTIKMEFILIVECSSMLKRFNLIMH